MTNDNKKRFSVYYMTNENDKLWIKDKTCECQDAAIIRARMLSLHSSYRKIKVIQHDADHLEEIMGEIVTP